MGFPAERTTSIEIRHMHGRHEEIRRHSCGPSRRAFAHVPTDQRPIWSDLNVFRVSCRYVFIPCLAQTPALPEIFLLPAKDVCRNIITICTPTQQTGESAYFLQLLLSEKHNCIEREFLFFLGNASLQRKDCPLMANP